MPPEPIHILLVEDNRGDARLIREHLEIDRGELGWSLDHVATYAEALERLRGDKPDVVLLDLSLPDAHGLDACLQLLHDVVDCPPLIVLTGQTDRDIAARAVAAGAQDFLVKDKVDHDVLVRSVRYAIERHRANVALVRMLEREQQMVGQLQELDRLKNHFVAMASHELRTPLASIAGFATTLRERWHEIPDGDRHAYVGIIDDQGRRLSRLVDDLLVLSRIESGAIDAHPEPVELERAIRLVLTELDMHAPQVTVDVPEFTCVLADRDHLDQMLVNYVSNAVKYGASPISVESRVTGDFIEVLVRDSGIGVPDDVAPILFEEFARGKLHAEERIQGTGLGLSIVRGLARAQGGDAWYEPNLPHGATFALRLPCSISA
ncbi:MAG: signal transduction histidine kinase [Thermoleophilia bacterium]|nr:signal transduction histidine kinase [Thermoleophilia bacterium]